MSWERDANCGPRSHSRWMLRRCEPSLAAPPAEATLAAEVALAAGNCSSGASERRMGGLRAPIGWPPPVVVGRPLCAPGGACRPPSLFGPLNTDAELNGRTTAKSETTHNKPLICFFDLPSADRRAGFRFSARRSSRGEGGKAEHCIAERSKPKRVLWLELELEALC